jgi:Ni,Fe-hydrogenase I cytochrome b subunit
MPTGDRWLTLALCVFIAAFSGFHLSRPWLRPSPRVVGAVTVAGWAVLMGLAVLAVFSIHRG